MLFKILKLLGLKKDFPAVANAVPVSGGGFIFGQKETDKVFVDAKGRMPDLETINKLSKGNIIDAIVKECGKSPISELTDLQKRFSLVYEAYISRADVYPLIPDLTLDHDLCVIPSRNQNELQGFYMSPRFDGQIELKVQEIFLDLFDETGLKVNAQEIGLIVSWNVFNRLRDNARLEKDEAHAHVFDSLIEKLDSVIVRHPNERLIGLAYQTIDYQSNMNPAPLAMGTIH